MAKILKNTTENTVFIDDTGVSIPANTEYTITPQEYLLWTASSSVIVKIGNGDIIVNDGSQDLSISDGIDLLKGIYQKTRLIGQTDGTLIGNVEDSLKAHITSIPDVEISNTTQNPVPIAGNVTATLKFSDIQKNAEFNISTKVETDIATVTHTVSANKSFYLTQFACASDSPSPISFYVRVYNGANLVNTAKINLASNGAWGGHSWPNGVKFAEAGQIVKITVNPQAAKGSGWAMFAGFEV